MFKYGVNSGPYFPAFGLNTERYEVSLRILSECRKIRTRNNSVFGNFSRTAKIGWKQFSVSFPSRNESGNGNQKLRKKQFSALIKFFLGILLLATLRKRCQHTSFFWPIFSCMGQGKLVLWHILRSSIYFIKGCPINM